MYSDAKIQGSFQDRFSSGQYDDGTPHKQLHPSCWGVCQQMQKTPLGVLPHQQPEKLQPAVVDAMAVVYAEGASTWSLVSVKVASVLPDSLNCPVE
jgi:hypothetical protein